MVHLVVLSSGAWQSRADEAGARQIANWLGRYIGATEAWKQEVIGHEELFILLHDHLPPEMIYERELLICRL